MCERGEGRVQTLCEREAGAAENWAQQSRAKQSLFPVTLQTQGGRRRRQQQAATAALRGREAGREGEERERKQEGEERRVERQKLVHNLPDAQAMSLQRRPM